MDIKALLKNITRTSTQYISRASCMHHMVLFCIE